MAAAAGLSPPRPLRRLCPPSPQCTADRDTAVFCQGAQAAPNSVNATLTCMWRGSSFEMVYENTNYTENRGAMFDVSYDGLGMVSGVQG